MNDWERQTWRCAHCLVHGSAVWAVRDGPNGPRVGCFLLLFSVVTVSKKVFEANARNSPYAVTAASPSSATSGSHHGRKICITLMSPSGVDSVSTLPVIQKFNTTWPPLLWIPLHLLGQQLIIIEEVRDFCPSSTRCIIPSVSTLYFTFICVGSKVVLARLLLAACAWRY